MEYWTAMQEKIKKKLTHENTKINFNKIPFHFI